MALKLRSSGGVSRTALAIQIPSKRPLVAGRVLCLDKMSVSETHRGFTWIYIQIYNSSILVKYEYDLWQSVQLRTIDGKE